jgi:crotonobetainyl-CoA:carnitine CoA-transferase CaiB-like acyl-CoA transferase
MSKLLAGVRVIECAVLFNGDSLGMLLADLGAEVIKVESPGQGDYLRDFLGQVTPHNSPAHLQVNKNKRSITLDLRRDEGRDVFFELLKTADVFVDGFAGDACDKLGIGYEAQRAIKPDVVYCQYTGFGSTGPYASIPTHGQMMNALAGGTPMRAGGDGLAEPDPTPELMHGTASGGEGTAAGAVHAAYHVAGALFRRERTGQGCFIDVSAADAVIASAWIGATYNLNEHRITDRRGLPEPGKRSKTSAKYQHYQTRDGCFVLLCAIEPKFWRNFCLGIDRRDLEDAGLGAASDSPVDFAIGELELRQRVAEVIADKDLADWMKFAVEHDVPLGPAHRVADLPTDPHLAARGIVVNGEHPLAGQFTYVGEPAIVDGEPYEVPKPAPALGEHTAEILTELGHAPAYIDHLRQRGIV